MAGEAPDPATLVDLARYPITDPGSPGWRDALADARAQLDALGAAELPGFLHPAGVEAVVADACRHEARAHHSEVPGTAYLELPDPSWPEGHPRRWVGRAALGAVAWDLFDADSPIRALYEWDPLLAFVAAVLDRGPLYRYADPLGGLNLAVMRDGDELQWHFDQTDFVVSLAVRSSEAGGDFEVAPRIRRPDDERYDDVAAVLAGAHPGVIRLPMRPGTLLVFEGRYSLHRVTPVRGRVSRLVALFGYDTRPGTTSSDLLKQVRYGRTVPVGAAPGP